MKTLLLSDYLRVELLPGVVCSQWEESHPSPADFQCVVLDMKLLAHGTTTLLVYLDGYPFYGLFDDLVSLIQAGGVVICLNYYTVVNVVSRFNDTNLRVHQAINEKRRGTFSYEYKHHGPEETSYDWLDLGLLQRTQLDRMNARPGGQFKVISTLDVVKQYFLYVEEYHKIIHGIRREPDARHGHIEWHFREKPDYSNTPRTDDEVEVLAVTEVTDDPIAVVMKYRGFPGTLAFLPTYNLPDYGDPGREETARLISSSLSSLGEYYYEINRRELGVKLESPPWLLEYRAKPAKDADKELEDLKKAEAASLAKRDRHDRMLPLINGYGDPLENAVAELFSKEWLGFDVEKTEPGHPIDAFVKNTRTGQTLAVQATGVVGKFNQRDKHFGALMRYLPEHTEKNTGGRIERIVLVVNTYRDTPLVRRTDETDISAPVRNLVTGNRICLIKSCELYDLWNLWVDSPEKLPPDDIFKQLFECEGIWQRK